VGFGGLISLFRPFVSRRRVMTFVWLLVCSRRFLGHRFLSPLVFWRFRVFAYALSSLSGGLRGLMFWFRSLEERMERYEAPVCELRVGEALVVRLSGLMDSICRSFGARGVVGVGLGQFFFALFAVALAWITMSLFSFLPSLCDRCRPSRMGVSSNASAERGCLLARWAGRAVSVRVLSGVLPVEMGNAVFFWCSVPGICSRKELMVSPSGGVHVIR